MLCARRLLVLTWSNCFIIASATAFAVDNVSARTGRTLGAAALNNFDVDAWQVGNPDAPVNNLQNTCFDLYWEHISDKIKVDETTDKVILHVEGHSFYGRMAVLQLLIFSLGDAPLWERLQWHDRDLPNSRMQTPESTQSCREWHWLWGYAAQMDWQHRSGRLAFGSDGTDDDDALSSKSWWNYMNFCFSVAILLAANNTRLLSQAFGGKSIAIELDQKSQELVERDVPVQRCIESWENLFRNGYKEYTDSVIEQVDMSDAKFRQLRFKYQGRVWQAHTAVIDCAVDGTKATELLSLLPVQEQNFGRGWAGFVEILAAATFPTDLVTIKRDGAGFLPLVLVSDAVYKDWTENSDGLSTRDRRHYKAVLAAQDTLEAPPSQNAMVTSFFKRIVRTESVSRTMPGTVVKLVHGGPLTQASQLVRVLFLFLRPRGQLEWSIALLVGVIGMSGCRELL